jgi:hypothetical protein
MVVDYEDAAHRGQRDKTASAIDLGGPASTNCPLPPTAYAQLSRRADKHRSTPREDPRRLLLNAARAIQGGGSLISREHPHLAVRSGNFVPDSRE